MLHRIVHHTFMPHSSRYLEMMISDYSGGLNAGFTISNLDGKHFRVLFLTRSARKPTAFSRMMNRRIY